MQLTPPLPPTIILRSILSFPTAFTRSACRLIGFSTGISAKLSATCFPALCSPHLTADWMFLSSNIQIRLTAAYRNSGTQSTASTVTEADTDAFSLTQDMAIKSGRKSNPSSFLRISNMCLWFNIFLYIIKGILFTILIVLRKDTCIHLPNIFIFCY